MYVCTMTSRDPEHITPELKSKLRQKNRLMRAGRLEKANALAHQVGKELKRRSKSSFCKINGKTVAKHMWEAVRKLTGRRLETGEIPGVNATTLNNHYAAVSSDTTY